MYETDIESRFLVRIVWRISFLAITLGLAVLMWALPARLYGSWHYDNSFRTYLAIASLLHGYISGYSFGLLGFIYLIASWVTQVIYLNVSDSGWTLSPKYYHGISHEYVRINLVFWLFGCIAYYGIKWTRREMTNS